MKSQKQNQSGVKPKTTKSRITAVIPTVIDSVRTWLDQQGFPLEMRTASAFRAGFDVRQSS